MSEFNILKYLMDVAPTVLVLGYGYWLMYCLYKDERKTNHELQEHIRVNEKENLELLKDFSNLLGSISQLSVTSKDAIISSIISEAKDIKQHIDIRISKDIRDLTDDIKDEVSEMRNVVSKRQTSYDAK